MISCAKHTIFGCDFCSGAQPPGAANDVHAEIEGCHCEPVVLRAANQNLNDRQWQSYLSVAHAGVAPSRDSLRSQSPGYSGSLNRISRGRCPHRPQMPSSVSHLRGTCEPPSPRGKACGNGLRTSDIGHWFAMTLCSDKKRRGLPVTSFLVNIEA